MAASFWPDAPRENFTQECLKRFCSENFEYVDGIGTTDLQVMQRHVDLLATVEAVKESKANGAIRRAVLVSNN